jgi:arylsulfatase A-like enzyme
MTAPKSSVGSGGVLPDVLVIVMDCVRASDFPGGGPEAVAMPFIEKLRAASITFPRAISVAPWTLPSHASLFTGLYPWEHGCHGRGTLRLDPRFERLAQTLSQRGYRTASFSGNPIISPFYGLADGFQTSEWGEWWEQVHRTKSFPSHTYRAASDPPLPDAPKLSLRDQAGRAIKTMLTRYPAILSLEDAATRRTVDPGRTQAGSMNPWIETDLLAWIEAQPTGTPTFAFLNTIDAHEPYLLDPADAPSWRDWWEHMRIPQDVLALLARDVPPSARDLKLLHDLYRRAITRLDRRIERFVEIYRRAGRWDNTLMVLTSDHGQAFGEHGMVWHGVRTDEEMLRIPLFLRLPDDERGGAVARGWASPMDVPTTVLERAGGTVPAPTSGRSLTSLVDAERSEPLLAAGDGTEWNRPFLQQLSPRRRGELNQFSVAGYLGDVKIVLDATSGDVRAFHVTGSPTREPPAIALDRAEVRTLTAMAREAARELLHPSAVGVGSAVDERLRSWGYG